MVRHRTDVASGHLWVEEGERREGMIAEVAPIIPIGRTYSFAVPREMEEALAIGQRVRVSLGRRGQPVLGFVVGLDRGIWESTLRPIVATVDRDSFLTPHLVELGRRIARHYACPLGRTLKAMTPESVRRQRGLVTVRYVRLARTPEEILNSGKRIGKKRRCLIDVLAGADGPIPLERLLAESKASRSLLGALAKEGWITILTRKEVRRKSAPPPPEPPCDPPFELNEEQRAALREVIGQIDAKRFCVTLLFGVSGSGKTEVYIRAIRHVVAAGRQAILLVPEIVLTTQLVQRLASRLGDVAVSHSGLSEAKRSIIWRRVANGEKKVVIGTRSAVFAPCPDLGLICVDEEQETSFKNLQAPRFNVRDVAIMRAQQLGIPVLLGSATPLVETWYRANHRHDYRLLRLRRRVKELPMPRIHIVDMRDEYAERNKTVVLSRLMERLLMETLGRGEQALIMMNRRGFARRIYCPACRMRVSCPNCNVGLVVHSASGLSICHYCRARITTPTVCPNVTCGERLVQVGLGTQRVEEVLAQRFPGAHIQRVDSDTMSHRREYERIIKDFEAQKIDILLGTQMIAKGLDFPLVSFVGVVQAEMGTLAGDFRSHERLFQLVTQVAGRAGRADASGQVVVQTTTPELPALKYALRHDYESFVADELETRRRAGLPPFRRLARIVLAHPREETAREEAEALAERVRETIGSLSLEGADVLGPSPCVLSRIQGRYRYDLLLRTLNASGMRELTRELEESSALRTKAESMIIDVDPVTLV